ncbi:MAG: hypothetical protein HC774_05990 [Sphingomonadales bacterium]|nr:hypothetical protein [Sphingomonadales bacterium]
MSLALSGNVKHRASGVPIPDPDLQTLVTEFFMDRTLHMEPIDGAIESLQSLAEDCQIVMLTNLPHEAGALRRRNLEGHGLPYPVVTNSGPKGPAIAALSKMADAPVVFIDDNQRERERVATSQIIIPNGPRLGGKVIEVDKKKQDAAIIPIETARDVIRVGYNSAQAQVCEMWEAQVANFDTLMRIENAKKKWSDQQMLYITTLHRMTIHVVAGKIRVVDEKGELKVFLEPIEPSKDACPDDKRKKVAEAIETYVKANTSGEPAPAKAVQQPTSQPTTTSSTTPKKK